MRIEFAKSQGKEVGKKLSTLLRNFGGLPNKKTINLSTLQELSILFHGLGPEEQADNFSNPLWEIIGGHANQVIGKLAKVNHALDPALAETTTPVVPGFKEAVDIIIETNKDGKKLYVPAINVDKGGLASNTMEALRLLGLNASNISISGNGPIATLHKNLLEACGIEVKVVDSGRDNYIHPCILFCEGNIKSEYWLAQKRSPFSSDVIDEFTSEISLACKANSGDVLVLSSIPPSGAGNDYFAKLALIGRENNNFIFFNPKQYDDMKEVVLHLFQGKNLGLAKPNIVEFVKFLRCTGIISDSNSEEERFVDKLKNQVKQGELNETISLAKELMNKYDNGIHMLLISFSEDGSIIMNSKWAVHISAPQIEVGCSSGAGDSGTANVIATAKRANIDLHSDLNYAELQMLGEGFNYAASATASLPGNQIAGLQLIQDLQSEQALEVKVKRIN